MNQNNIVINNKTPQKIGITQLDNQEIIIDGGSIVTGVSDVLVNDKSVVDKGIAYVEVPTKTSELVNNSGFITTEIDPTVPTYVKNITQADIVNWNSKQPLLVSGTNIKTINSESLLGSGNLTITGNVYTGGTGISIDAENVISNDITSYNDLSDLPDIPYKTSDLINDNDFVSEDELSDVAFSGSYVDLSNTPDIPTDISELENDVGYITESDYASSLHGGTIKAGVNSYDINSVGQLYADTQTYADYGSLANTNFIGKGTLENVLTGKGFITNSVNDLTNYTLTSNLSNVALSGDYDDLTNKPSIPSVNDGTLTIQINGTTVNTFTANSSSNVTTNITVPTHTSDLSNDSGFITSSSLPQDSGWQDITLANGVTQRGSSYKPQYRKIGKVVYLRGQVTIPAHNSIMTICNTLPEGYRPSQEAKSYGMQDNWIATNGDWYVATNNNSASNQNLQTWYLVD